MRALPQKKVVLDARPRTIFGLSADDPYFGQISNAFEEPFSRFCSRFVREEYVCIDVGANIGITTLIMAEYCRSGKVVSIEPSTSTFAVLRKNISANGIRNAIAMQVAIGEKEGLAKFVENSAYSYVSEQGTEVPMTTLSALVERLGLSAMDFIKIDVEGFESAILRHSIEVLKRFAPLIYLEFNSWCLMVQAKVNPVDFLEWLCRSFEFVFVVVPSTTNLLEPLDRRNLASFLYRNLTNGFVNDLVVTNDASRLAANS
jgi:FkbM family methyltransferase